jgi:hypothetical protein
MIIQINKWKEAAMKNQILILLAACCTALKNGRFTSGLTRDIPVFR